MISKILSIVILFLANSVFADNYFDKTVIIEPGDNYAHAEFRLVIPEKYEEMRGILMLLPGFNGSSVKSPQLNRGGWFDFAKKHKMALFGLSFKTNRKISYDDMGYDSAKAFQKALKHFAAESNVPEIEDLPFLINGASAGGQVAYGLAAIWPEKIIAFTAIKGGYYLTNPSDITKTAQLPAIIYIGEVDTQIRRDNLNKLFSEHRVQGAPWVLAIQPGVGHGAGGTDRLTLSFFEEIMAMRVGNDTKLIPVDFAKSWSCALNDTTSIQPFDIKDIKDKNRTWLPSEEFAKKWQNFVNK